MENINRELMQKQKVLLILGAVAGPLLITVVLIQGETRSGCNSIQYSLSFLSIGKWAGFKFLNFITAGVLLELD